MSRTECLVFIVLGIAIAVAGWFLDSDFGFAMGIVIAAMGMEELLKPRIDSLSARERTEGGEG